MVTRIWHGKTKRENAETYLKFLLNEGTKEYREVEGNISARVWKNENETDCDFWTVTEWTSIDSIKEFAGTDYNKAKYYPNDKGMLLEFEEKVTHREAYDVSNTKIRHHIRQLELLYNGGNWVGESFKGKLDDLNSGHAFTAPVAGVHSVAEIIWHCIYWRRVTLNRLQGGENKYRDETAEEYNFLPIERLRTKGWDTIRQQLEESQNSLVAFLKDKNDSFLINEYEQGYSYDYLIEGTIQHDYYHLGQVGLALKILKMKQIM
jgi:uncharacterized damage-inducible protein DinB/heme-degrading monooxygenase HmoA